MLYMQKTARILSEKGNDMRKIIRIFEIIAQVNTLTNNQRYTYAKKLNDVIMTEKEIYQNLIKCASNFEVLSNINNSKEARNDVRDDDENDEKYDDQENNVLQNVLFLTANDSHNFENEILFIQERIKQAKSMTAKKRRDRKSRTSKYDKLLTLFNVHADLHLAKMIRKYMIIMNLNVLFFEIKHMWV